jgi:general stress protein 26
MHAEPVKAGLVPGTKEPAFRYLRESEEAMADTSEEDFERKLWKALKSDMTVMLGLAGIDDRHTRPMTAQFDPGQKDDGKGPIWFFTSKEAEIVKKLQPGARAIATFADKGHDIFAAIHGSLTLDNDRATVDRLWNRFVAAWFEKGKDDPKLALLRFDLDHAKVWIDASSTVAAVKLLLGADPKQDYKNKVGEVRLN